MSKIFSYQAWPVFLRFGGLSGLGWLFDFFIYLSIVAIIGLSPFVANFISSSMAAILVFTVSRMWIFDKAEGALFLRIIAYYLYSALAIIASSFAIKYLVLLLVGLSEQHGYSLIQSSEAALAKISITPPLLLMNFLMSRILSERS